MGVSGDWRVKAHQLIEQAAWTAYYEVNYRPDGRKYKNHRPYTLPKWADDLVECLGRDDEEGAKAIFLNQYLRDY